MFLLLISLTIFLILGVPIAYSLGLSTLAYFFLYQPDLIQVLPQRLFAGMDSYALIALPLFIFMGQVMKETKGKGNPGVISTIIKKKFKIS